MQAGNPYIAGSPLRDPKGFFGRRDIIDWVSAELSNIHTDALVLYGQRRVGKTTILLQLRHSLSSDKFFPVYFDLQDQAKKRLGEVLANLADVIGSQINLSEHKPENFDDEGKYFRSIFLPDLYKTLDIESRPVFLLDEFDVLDQGDEGSLENNVASRALFPFLRQVMDDDIRSAFVFVVGRRTEDLRVDFNQMFKTSLTKEVWVLDRLSAETLVRQAEVNGTLKFTQQSVDRILQLTKSHAYLTQLVCQRLWQRAYINKPVNVPTIDVDDVVSCIPDALEVGEQALIWLWNGLGPAEKIYAAVLAEISDEGKAISEDQVIKVLAEHAARARLRRREVELAPQDLITRHVLDLTDNREYIFAIELFRRWVKQKRSLKDVVDEIDKVDPLAQQLFELGQVYYKKHEWTDAVRFFNDALRQNPSHFRANLLLGETFLAMGQMEDAVHQLEIAYSLDSYESQYPLARALIALAKEKEKNGLDKDALTASERALEISPNERLAQDIRRGILEREGDNALRQGDLNAALSAFEKVGNAEKVEQVGREYKRKELQTLKQDAESFTQKRDWKQAILAYEQLIEKSPDEKSKAIWQSGLAKCKEEEKLESLFTLGLGALTSGDWEQAKRTLSEVVYIRPDYVKDNKSAVKLLGQAIAGRRPITVETVFQSSIFRVLSSTSLLILLGYLAFSAIQGLGVAQNQEPTQTALALTEASVSSSIVITNTPQPPNTSNPTTTVTPTLTPMPTITTIPQGGGQGQIIFLSGNYEQSKYEVYSVNIDGTQPHLKQLTSKNANINHPVWSPTGKKIAFSMFENGFFQFYLMNPDGSELTRISKNAKEGYEDLAWAPDGKKLAFDSLQGNYNIFTMYSDGSNEVQLTSDPGSDMFPEWSPDGKKIAFISSRSNFSEVYVMNADGTNQTQLTFLEAAVRDVNWSPDGKHIVFASTKDHELWEIYQMQSDGTEIVRLTSNDIWDLRPKYSPDGTKIYWDSCCFKLYTMNPDGSGVTNIYSSMWGWDFQMSPSTTFLIYDDFKNSNYDGSYKHSLWSKAGDNSLDVSQENGALTFATTDTTKGGEYALLMRKPSLRPIDRIKLFEARLKVDEQQKGFSFAKIQIMAENINGYTWSTQCGLGWGGASFICTVDNFDSSGNRTEEYQSNEVKTKLNTWYTVRIEIDPTTATIHFYLDGTEIGAFTPKDASELISANNFVPRIGVWDESSDSIFKYEITDVRITP